MTDDFDVKFSYFDKIKDDASFRSIWSIYEVNNIYDLSGFTAETLVYKDHWVMSEQYRSPYPAVTLSGGTCGLPRIKL